MRARIRELTFPAGRRILAVSDIHGNLEYLKGLLKKAAFSADDILVIVGDMLEKGPESLRTLHFIMKLCEEYTVIPLLGNCDEWDRAVAPADAWSEVYVRQYLVHNIFRYPGLLGQMCIESGIPLTEDLDVPAMKARLRERYQKEFAFLAAQYHILETPHYTFVHGGLPEGAPEDWDAWNCTKNDDFLSQGRSFDKWQIVGHWPVVLYGTDKVCANPIILRDRKIISIDGGCVLKDDGQLNALIIPSDGSEDFGWTAYDPFPIAQVCTAQKGSEKSYYIRWGDNLVEVLQRGEEFCRCRHIRTGYVMDILTKYLTEEDGQTRCNDCTDYVLPLEAGDRVSVVETTSRGYFVKHNGTSGWYLGELCLNTYDT